MTDYQIAHELIRTICQVAATKAAMPSASPEKRAGIREMGIEAAELAYCALNFEQFMSIPYYGDGMESAERRAKFVEATMRAEEAAVDALIASLV